MQMFFSRGSLDTLCQVVITELYLFVDWFCAKNLRSVWKKQLHFINLTAKFASNGIPISQRKLDNIFVGYMDQHM